MGHRASRARSCSTQNGRQSGSFTNGPTRSDTCEMEPKGEPEKPRLPFRYEDRSKIPDDLVDGPFEDFEIAGDVYATAYLIARNSGDMYSIWPWKNRDVMIVWMFLLFIAGSQLFVILSVTFWYPPSVKTESMLLVCSNETAVTNAYRQGFLSVSSTEECINAGKWSFQADSRGMLVQYYTLEQSTLYYDSILKEGDCSIYLLRLICCVWVFSQVYFQGFASIRSLLLYHDFSCWFLPLKGEGIRNGWAIGITLVQYSVLLVVLTVSFMIICAQAEAFDIVMNSLAFTFISEVGSFFNEPLSKRMGSTPIKDLPEDYGPDPIYYLYPEYSISNAENDDGTYTDGGWYILEDEQKAGMLSDYRIRHNANKYPHIHSEKIGHLLERVLFVVPVLVVCLGAIKCHCFTRQAEGVGRADL